MAQHCPAECLELIFSYLQTCPSYDRIPVREKGYRQDRIVFTHDWSQQGTVSLAACTVVCRSWSAPAQDALYTYINMDLMATREREHNFLAVIEATPRLAARVQVLHADSQDTPDETLARTLAALLNLETYSLHVSDSVTSLPASIVPDERHTRLTRLALLGRQRMDISRQVLNQLPPSLRILWLERAILPHSATFSPTTRSIAAEAKPNLSNLEQLCVLPGTRFAPDTFENCKCIDTVLLLNPILGLLEWVFAPMASNLTTLKLYKNDPSWSDELYSALSALRVLELCGNFLSPNRLPTGLHRLVWAGLNEENLFALLRNFGEPSFLPELRTIPALYAGLQSKGMNPYVYNGGDDPVEYYIILQRARQSLEARGLLMNDSATSFYDGTRQVWAPRGVEKAMSFGETRNANAGR